jgi:outer membrane lipoprotein carrier protein
MKLPLDGVVLEIRRVAQAPGGERSMNSTRRIMVSIFAAILLSMAHSANGAFPPGNIDALVTRLQTHYQATHSFTAKFTETLSRPGAPPRERSGVVQYQKPGRMRWEFSGSQPETIVSDGTTIYDYDPGLDQVVETPLRRAAMSRGAAAFLLGVGNLKRDFIPTASTAPSSDGLAHVILKPKGQGDPVELGVDPATSNIVTLRLADAMGNVTLLRFNEIKTNPPLESSTFSFKVPPGADIVNADSASHGAN